MKLRPLLALTMLLCVYESLQAQAQTPEAVAPLEVGAQASMLGPITTFDEPTQAVCELGDDFVAYIRGHLGDLLLIKWRDRIVYYRDGESREIMGGGRLECGELIWWDDELVALMGRENDILMVFDFDFDATGELILISRALEARRDGPILNLRFAPESGIEDQVLYVFGRLHDLTGRLCFDEDRGVWVLGASREIPYDQCKYDLFTDRWTPGPLLDQE